MNSTMTPLHEAARWSLRLADGDADESAFQAWLNADAAHRQAYDELAGTLAGVDGLAGAPEMVNLRGEALVLARRSHDLLRAKAFFSSRLGIAAGIAALAIAAGAAGMWLNMQSHTFATGVAERRTFELADGSRLSLDAATEVKVRYTADRRRLVLGQGRAKFDVAKDPLRPFAVEAGGQVVVATGTSFSVELVEKQMHVVLYEGRVEVLPAAERNAASRVALNPGQELIAADGKYRTVARVAAVDPPRTLAWESGELAFADEPLALAVERVNRYSKTPLKVADQNARSVRISGVFHAGDTEAFIDGVTSLFPVRAERDARGATFVFEDKKPR